MIKNVLIVVLLVVTLLLAVGLMSAQVTIDPVDNPVTIIEQGADGMYYAFCLHSCEGLVTAADVTERYRGQPTFQQAFDYYETIRVRIP